MAKSGAKGATGAQGAPVAAALLAAGHYVTAAVRNPATYSGDAVAVNLGDVDSLAAAYSGAEGVFVHLPLGSAAQQREHGLVAAMHPVEVADGQRAGRRDGGVVEAAEDVHRRQYLFDSSAAR